MVEEPRSHERKTLHGKMEVFLDASSTSPTPSHAHTVTTAI